MVALVIATQINEINHQLITSTPLLLRSGVGVRLYNLYIMKFTYSHLFLLLCFCSFNPQAKAQEPPQKLPVEVMKSIGGYITSIAKTSLSIGAVKIDSTHINGHDLTLYANYNCSYIPFRESAVKSLYAGIRNLLPVEFAPYKIKLVTDHHAIEDLIPLAMRSKPDKKAHTFTNKVDKPLVTRLSLPYKIEKGLLNRHIAMWQSHGFYFEQKLNRWEWQRARIFQTVEDLYPQSYVVPYLVPMLENAGANVLLPRERDTQTNEVIVDNDANHGSSSYLEDNAVAEWEAGARPGFANRRAQYVGTENPFTEGTYRQIKSVRKGKESSAAWIAEIPESGRYAVYVSYKTLPKSVNDALYTVYHKGGSTSFKVNQRMGGGTWIFLDYFNFDAGQSGARIVLSNLSGKADELVTADAVKIGGGLGNIARKVNDALVVSENKKSSDSTQAVVTKQLPAIPYQYELSGYPRYTEAARYWLQWAGVPDSIYSPGKGKNDYTDDYRCRGKWVNYISGGSSVAPDKAGLNIPVDLAFAFHTDAGTTLNDSIIGTLGIFYTRSDTGVFNNGVSRYASHDLTDLIQSQIVSDVRRCYEPEWARRGMWNKSYSEANEPNVPTMLLELLSHQNFADMRYGLDPRFRFTVSRAIYKGMLQFLSSQYKQKYVVQPLPVDHFSIRFVKGNKVELKWRAVIDSLEPTALPDKYVVYTRVGTADFDNGLLVDKNSCVLTQHAGVAYSYKIVAVNQGGAGFPSEILSAYKAVDEKGVVLIVNGFDRISGPADFVSCGMAGFNDALDHGVPDKQAANFIGSQNEYRRIIPWMDDDAAGFGASNSNYESKVIAGNTFDYPALHGRSIAKAGYSYVSSSNESVMDSLVNLKDYKLVDLILGKQKQTKIGRGVHASEFKTFPSKLQQAIRDYCNQGGNIFVSGSYVATDLWDNGDVKQTDTNFAKQVLKYQWRVGQAATEGKVKTVASPFSQFVGKYTYYNTLNDQSYVVESPDGIEPAEASAFTVFRYSENNLSAGVVYQGKYKTCVLGFPFESVKNSMERDLLMNSILTFFEK